MGSLWKLLENNIFLYIVFPFHVAFCCRSTKARHPHILGLFSILITLWRWPFLMGAAVCCWLRATSGAGVEDLGWSSPLLTLLMCWGWFLRAELQLLPCREQPRGPLVTQAWSCLGARESVGPGDPVPSEAGKLCQCGGRCGPCGWHSHLWHRGEAESDTEFSFMEMHTQWAAYTECAWGYVSSQLPNIILVLKWGTEQPTVISDCPVSHRLGLCVTGECSLIAASSFAVLVLTAAGSLLEHRALLKHLGPSGISPMGAGLLSLPGMLILGWKQGTGGWNRALVGWYLNTDSLLGVSDGWDPADKLSTEMLSGWISVLKAGLMWWSLVSFLLLSVIRQWCLAGINTLLYSAARAFFPLLSFALIAGIIIDASLCSGGNCETGSREFLNLSF